jgi:hypothetical protein
MLPEEKIMEVLEAYDLTLSYRLAAKLCVSTITPSPVSWQPASPGWIRCRCQDRPGGR